MESRTASVKRRVRRKRKRPSSSNSVPVANEKTDIRKEEKKINIKPPVQSALVPINFRMTDFGTTKDDHEKGSRKAMKSDIHGTKKNTENVHMSSEKPKPNELNKRNQDGVIKQGKKKSKKRSRQKNLRRDKRTKSELPEDLTEETLQTGRVYRDEKGALLTA